MGFREVPFPPQPPTPISQSLSMDTIAAIATPIGAAGIGVIRISGPRAREIASRLFRSPSGSTADIKSHTARHGRLIDPATGALIDDIVLTLFHAPHSYTGEDVAEISCHGGIAILKSALSAALSAGARLAEPGEFTKRAFLNGKVDLAQAEAVNDLIRARTDGARRVALSQLDGVLSEQVRSARDRVLNVITRIEAAVDFPDDVDEPEPQWVESEVRAAQGNISSLLASFSKGRIFREGLRLVIAGRVNVGKSSLLNALLRHARAIVTPIPGTTRDVIEESLEIHGIPIVALDTAGLRATDDPVEQLGVERTEHCIKSADLILLVVDISEGIWQADVELLNRLKDRPTILVLNKIDLLPEEARGLDTKEYVDRLGRSPKTVQTSASSGQGIGELEDAIAEAAASGGLNTEPAVVSNVRHQQCLRSALDSLDHALATLADRRPIDLLSIDLSACRNSLGLVTGETACDDLLDRIFSEFCIGK